MRNLQEYPITPKAVVDYLKTNIQLEELVQSAMGENVGFGDIDLSLAKTTLAVVRAASVIVQNDLGTHVELLAEAFNSQNVRGSIKEPAYVD